MDEIIIKNSEMTEDVISTLNKLLETKLPIVDSYRLLKIINNISNIYDNFKKLKELTIDKHILRDENGERIAVYDDNTNEFKGYKIENVDEFNKSMNEIFNLEEIIPFDKLDINIFSGLIDITPLELNTIHFLFK